MPKLSFKDVKTTCSKERFFFYEGFNDRLFVPPSIFLVWVFVRLGWSGNAVTLFSGVVAIIGAIMISGQSHVGMLIGSFGYMAFYLLDYVDGGVARINKQGSISGQYLDWMIHVVAAIGFSAGIFAGALSNSGSWLIPMGILFVTAAALSLDRYALAWFSICMHRQQQQQKGRAHEASVASPQIAVTEGITGKIFRTVNTLIFHENYIIFLLPLLSLLHLLYFSQWFDFRVVLVFLGAFLYFPVVCYDIWLMTRNKKIDSAYHKLFFSTEPPVLPDEHFLR